MTLQELLDWWEKEDRGGDSDQEPPTWEILGELLKTLCDERRVAEYIEHLTGG